MSLTKNTLWNLIGAGAPFLVGLVTIPYVIKHMGVEAFGILTLIWALIGYFSLFDFGLGRALTQQVAASLAKGEHERIPRLVKSGIVFTALTGIIGGLVLAAASHPLGYSWLKVSLTLQHDAAMCLLVAAIGIPLTTVTTGLRGAIEAYEDFKGVNILRAILGVANFGLPALCILLSGNSLTLIVFSLVIARLVILMAHVMLLHRKMPPDWFRTEAQAKEVKGLLSFGVWMTVSNIISPFMVTADRFVISSILGASLVAYYTVPFEILIRVLILPTALTSALFPRLASLLHTDPVAARKLYLRCIKVVFAVLAPLCIIIAAGSYWGLFLWLGKDFAEHSWLIVCILSLGILLNGIAFVPFATVQAAGQAKITACLHMLELVIYLPLLLLALHQLGLIGAAIVWVVRVGLDLILLAIFADKAINSHHHNIASQV